MRTRSLAIRLISAVLVLLTPALSLFATTTRTTYAPELDAGGLGSALTILIGTVMIIKDRRSRR